MASGNVLLELGDGRVGVGFGLTFSVAIENNRKVLKVEGSCTVETTMRGRDEYRVRISCAHGSFRAFLRGFQLEILPHGLRGYGQSLDRTFTYGVLEHA